MHSGKIAKNSGQISMCLVFWLRSTLNARYRSSGVGWGVCLSLSEPIPGIYENWYFDRGFSRSWAGFTVVPTANTSVFVIDYESSITNFKIRLYKIACKSYCCFSEYYEWFIHITSENWKCCFLYPELLILINRTKIYFKQQTIFRLIYIIAFYRVYRGIKIIKNTTHHFQYALGKNNR